MLKTTFNYLCANANKIPSSSDMQDKLSHFKERFGRVDNDILDKAMRLYCETNKFMPGIPEVIQFLNKVKREKADEFKYCARCKGHGRVSLILAIKKQRDKDNNLTRRKETIHREVWEFNRSREMRADPEMKKFYDDPDTYISEQSAFCLCERGQNYYESCGSNGLRLSQQEFRTA